MPPAVWIVAAALAAELEGAAVTIDVGETATRVEATYRFSSEGALRFRARRIAGQEVVWLTEGTSLEDGRGLVSFTSSASPVTVRYELRGERRRVPLFVPDASPAGPIEVRLRGVAGDPDLRDAFPRLRRTDAGDLVAEPANLPSFVRLPPPRGAFTVHRASEALVVVLVVLATGGWLVRRRLASRTGT
jgi:hypothetical protein